MENGMPWLVAWTDTDGVDTCTQYESLEAAVSDLRVQAGASLWQRAPFTVNFGAEPDPPPKKKRAPRRKRTDSPDPARTEAALPPAASSGPESGDVPAPAPRPPVKAVLSCGGARCTKVASGLEVHDALTCPQYQPKRAARG